MITVTTKAASEEEKRSTFPILKVYKTSPSIIVLFTKRTEGLCLVDDGSGRVGQFKTDWVACDSGMWDHYEGQIILRNS